MIGVIGIAAVNQTVIAKQLDNWQLLPQPQQTTELFFTDALHLPKVLRLGAPHDVAFTLHNVEHNQVTYRYTVSAKSGSDNTLHPLKSDVVTLNHDAHRSIVETIHAPAVSTLMALQVDLEYQGTGDDSAVGSQKQSIRYWIKVIGFQS